MSHTHWDREWYLPVSRFRQRLVELIDELLADDDAAGSFLLDGQMIVIEDYLAVRPERRAELSKRLRDGTIEAGPWYVLADELIPGGEALVRNLLTGSRLLRALRASAPGVLYCPDSFGHPAILPTLASGFGFPVIVLWRGYGGGTRWPHGDVASWRAPDGSMALLYHLPRDGYGFAALLPAEPTRAANRWMEMRGELAPRATTGVVLLPNGADHHARQPLLAEGVDALRAAAGDDEILVSSLAKFAERLVEAAGDLEMPVIEGELRDSYGYAWTLQGTFATRAYQKRMNARAERLLVREAEPWSAISWVRGSFSRRAHLQAAWTTLLQCHPHDTLCGCSIDEVARAMDVRLDEAIAQGRGVRDDALLDIVGHDPVVARGSRAAWREIVIARNSVPRMRGGVVELDIRRFLTDVPIGLGSAHAVPVPRLRLSPPALDGGRFPLQVLERELTHDRVESPRQYPDNDLVELSHAIAWMPPIAGFGTHAATLDAAPAPPLEYPSSVRATANSLDNGILSVKVDAMGNVRVEAVASGRVIPALLSFEDVSDVGDLYTHSPAGDVVTHATFLGAHLVHRGPLRGTIEGRWHLRLPASATLDHEKPALTNYSTPATPHAPLGRDSLTPLEITARISIDASAAFVRVDIRGDNTARDHRLRVVLATDVEHAEVWADAAFGPVRRTSLSIRDEDRAMETPPPTAPMHRYVSVFNEARGATVYSDGLAEYEALPDGGVGVTLLRAVGELSRNDLPERPGHAGWPTPTPQAQCLGPFEGRFALLLHGARTGETIGVIESTADDVLVPLRGSTLRSALAVPPPTAGLTLVGQGLAFGALKESEDGSAVVLRCVNLTDDEVTGRWILGFPAKTANLARLDETPLGSLALADGEVSFIAGPREVVTILLK